MFNELGYKPTLAKKKVLKARMYCFDKSLKPFEVDSAFGGLAIYKRQVLNKIRYAGVRVDGSEICEHVALNEQIRENGYKIFLNPGLINCNSYDREVKLGIKKRLLKIRHILPFLRGY